MVLIIVLVAVLLVLIAVVVVVVRRVDKTVEEKAPVKIASDCCGSHAVCERDTLLSSTDDIVYFDDEELDILSGVAIEDFTDENFAMIEEVFFSLREQDVSGWVRSLQLRNIQLPSDLREQALLIIAERRDTTLENWNAKHKED